MSACNVAAPQGEDKISSVDLQLLDKWKQTPPSLGNDSTYKWAGATVKLLNVSCTEGAKTAAYWRTLAEACICWGNCKIWEVIIWVESNILRATQRMGHKVNAFLPLYPMCTVLIMLTNTPETWSNGNSSLASSLPVTTLVLNDSFMYNLTQKNAIRRNLEVQHVGQHKPATVWCQARHAPSCLCDCGARLEARG